jgi:hypothetical protein
LSIEALLNRVQRLQQWNTGTDQRGELAGEFTELRRIDPHNGLTMGFAGS